MAGDGGMGLIAGYRGQLDARKLTDREYSRWRMKQTAFFRGNSHLDVYAGVHSFFCVDQAAVNFWKTRIIRVK